MEYLSKWCESDAKDLAGALNNRNILNNLRDGLPYPYTEKDALDYIRFALKTDGDDNFFWAIRCEGKAVGSVGIFRKDNIHNKTAELGYYLAQPLWNRGIVTQAVKEACGFVFENTDIVRIFAEPFARNAGSCRVLEKCGFILEGTLRKNAYKNGAFEDMNLYALLKQSD
jgi:RimJ/RimL family protein N-acetyltransferase